MFTFGVKTSATMTKHQSVEVLNVNLRRASDGGKMVVITPHFVQLATEDCKVAELIFLSNKTLFVSGNLLIFPP